MLSKMVSSLNFTVSLIYHTACKFGQADVANGCPLVGCQLSRWPTALTRHSNGENRLA